MLKKFFSSKKLILASILTVVVIAAAATGATYAWLTARETSTLVVDMGDLKISSTLFPNADNPDIVEPGRTFRHEGKIKNEGTIACAVVVDYSTALTIKADNSGNPIEWYTINNDPNITMELDKKMLEAEYLSDDGQSFYAWFSVDGQPGKYVLMMYGDVEPEIAYDVKLKGSEMGNAYQNATISYSSNWLATQMLNDAVDEVLHFNFGDLNDPGTGYSTFSVGGTSNRDKILAKIEEMLNR